MSSLDQTDLQALSAHLIGFNDGHLPACYGKDIDNADTHGAAANHPHGWGSP